MGDANFADILKGFEKKLKRTKKHLGIREKAQGVVDDYFKNSSVNVVSARNGDVLVETTSGALFQEIEGFHREELIQKLHAPQKSKSRNYAAVTPRTDLKRLSSGGPAPKAGSRSDKKLFYELR